MSRAIYRLRSWQRRAETLERNAAMLMSDMIESVGVDYVAAGENMTSQADDVVATAQNLVNYLETCIAIQKRAKGGI